ncbi:MAG: DUF1343 domain-containing protein [Acidimicrobiia bacterium]|nr:DUF1343 domain-containing protein [Acidimicrobiia bacterium]MDH4362723.1 DUF1343 domain-containing protein [Acidimicrobiia bacterium]MDH5288575.1 DUF1343 domain-containing protein [Acidimicrobiia bacterium]
MIKQSDEMRYRRCEQARRCAHGFVRGPLGGQDFANFLPLVVVISLLIVACGRPDDPEPVPEAATAGVATTAITTDDATIATGSGDAVMPAPVRAGAEVAAADGFQRFRGQRLAVILNVASVVDGRSLLDALAAAEGVDVVAAFAPEHGVRGDAPAGAQVADTVDPSTGVTVHSLYGDRRAPDPDQLAGLDALMFDLQDVGARPYTYVSTMGLAMQAAAQAGVRFVVLDRPNPLGGTGVAGGGVEGWVLDPSFASFVGRYPVPLVHGLTAGELARMIQGEGWLDGLDGLQLDVVAMTGWHRNQRWADTGRSWIPPSPGLPSAATAAVYPGTVLFEATSASVGRGTDEPFSLIGAPWIDGSAAAATLNARGLPGVRFEAATFTPAPTPAVPDPPLAGRSLRGVRVVVTDPAAVRPVALGVHLLEVVGAQARAAGETGFVTRPATLDALAGTDRLRLALAAGAPATSIVAAWTDEDAAFDQLRQPYLLY